MSKNVVAYKKGKQIIIGSVNENNIKNMLPNATKYICYPVDTPREDIIKKLYQNPDE